ncbi:unnamed protein product [Ceutorhynchus assimilis]|uniref:Cytochrome P450 n=1 Tax=Ceutorhynchus assimilis TaxID=467358 RepID=A0A9N9MJQ6_9CUCU|nr:unnamed protein product [Ceutorhynchus assimilis]
MAVIISTGFILFDFFLIFLAAFIGIFVHYKHSYQYWKKKEVPYLEPTFPYGNNLYLFPLASTFAGESKVWYDQLKAKGHKFGGVWSYSRKVLVLVDPGYIKDILSLDFNHFIDRDVYCNEKHDPMGTHLFNIRHSSWKALRQKLTPTFTSGKMKMMFDNVLHCADFMINHLEKCANVGDDFDAREVLASFTTDVIGSVAFGVDCNSFDSTHAEFRRQGKYLFEIDLPILLKAVMVNSFPDLSRKLGVIVFRSKSKAFFAGMIKETMEFRKKNNINRPDFLQLLLKMNEEYKDGKPNVTFDEIVANTILFFIAGFDTSSTVMTFSCYELARNPEIQERTRQEIENVLGKYDGKITYEAIQEMTYLQQVMNESMRLFPPLICLARTCTKDYKLRDTDITIEKGTPVVISTFGLGRDAEHFPDPERFDPDRFSAEEIEKRDPYIHIPFGEGPRNCIGLRFGLMQSKIGLIRILTNFKLSISPKTKMPVTIDQQRFLLKENNPIYLRAEKI